MKATKIIINGKEVELGGEIYSTEEIQIGTWIDGKPLYRIAGTGVTPTDLSKYTMLKEIKDLEIAMYQVYVLLASSNTLVKDIAIGSAGGLQFSSRVANVGSLRGLEIRPLVSSYAGLPFYYVIEYTKTTDKAIIAVPSVFSETKKTENVFDSTAVTYSEV